MAFHRMALQLEELAARLAQAIETESLEDVVLLDEEVRAAFADALTISSTVPELRPAIERLLRVYREGISAFSRHRDQVQQELIDLGRSPKAAQAYRKAGSWGG